ncbi:MAG: glycosyltransferase [Planctomycetaceae bacterium]|nr:MAG: glycosyltransferase [Planctomycetaceae bacterium]
MTRPLRILHVIPAVAPRYGGPSTAIWPLTGALRDLAGLDVEIATTDANGPAGVLRDCDLPTGACRVHLFHRDSGETWKHSKDLARWLNVHAGAYDLIQSHGHWNHAALAASRAARRAHVPHVMRPCGMLSDYSWRKSRLKKQLYWWLLERSVVNHAAAFHVTSEQERGEVLRLGVSAPVEVIPLGIGDEARETPREPGWLRAQCPRAGNRPLVLFLSRIHPKKGIIDFLLPAVKQLKAPAFLAIVGGEDDQSPGYVRRVEQEIARLELTDRVALLGPVAPERRWAAFDGADLFVLPSHSENFGFVVAEAMARATPVVVTRGVQFAEHVTAAGAGDVVAADSHRLANSLDRWLVDANGRTAAGAAGREYIRRNFTWQSTALRLADLYRRICDDQAQPARARDDRPGDPVTPPPFIGLSERLQPGSIRAQPD